MGKLLYSMIVSLDGYVADREGEFSSWAQPDEQVLAAINEELEDVSTYLLGRRMYERMAVWETDAEVIEQSPESMQLDRKSKRLNSSHEAISYAGVCSK